MKKNYKLGDTFSLVSIKLTLAQNNGSSLVHYIPDISGVNKTIYETVFPHDEHKNVKAEIFFYRARVIDIQEQENGNGILTATNQDFYTLKYTLNDEGKFTSVSDDSEFSNQFTLFMLPELTSDDAFRYCWLRDTGVFVLDLDYLEFLVGENEKWEDNNSYRLDQELFNLLVAFIQSEREMEDSQEKPLFLHSERLEKNDEKEFNRAKNKVYNYTERKSCALISQLILPRGINHNLFLRQVENELRDSFPMKRELSSTEISIYYEKMAVPSHIGTSQSWQQHAEVKIIIFTSLYARLQSSIVGKRNVGTLAEKLMDAWANAMFDLGCEEREIKLNLYLNNKRHYIVNHFGVTLYEIYKSVVLPINDDQNWRNEIEGFIKLSNHQHGNKPVNLCCLKIKLNLPSATVIPNEAMLRLRADLCCEKDSHVLRVDMGSTLYLFYTARCIKARLKNTDELKKESEMLVSYFKRVFDEKMNLNYTVEDYCTIFNLYSDVDIEQVYNTIINRNNPYRCIKPVLTVY